MTHLSLVAPKTLRFPAMRPFKLAIGKLLAAIAGSSEAYGAAKTSAYCAAIGFGSAPKSSGKPEDDY